MKILITGGTNGMGKGVAYELAGIDNQIHELIILCRSKELGESLIKEFENTRYNKKVSIVICDLVKLNDVRNAINKIRSKHNFLDGIFINAGIGYAAERVETEDGMDSHFQVNYLSQFMLVLNLLDLLEKSLIGGRIIFNATKFGRIFWDDMQLKNKWSFENGIFQAMAAKRMLLVKLDKLYKKSNRAKLSFIGFQIDKTVWSNQINIIPSFMKFMASVMKFFGSFISIQECGKIMAPLFVENKDESFKRSGRLISWKNKRFENIKEDTNILDETLLDRLWEISLDLCADEKTYQISKLLHYSN